MNKFDMRSARLISIIIAMLLIFAIVVIKAYDYLPENKKEIIELAEENYTSENTRDESLNLTREDADNEKVEEDKSSYNEKSSNALEIISDEELDSKSNLISRQEGTEEGFESALNNARGAKKNKKFASAISEYQKAISLTDNNREKAQCYEEIAYIYGTTKRYGTALSYAQKAYNLAPNSSREMLLARLYYQTGDIEKATTRVNNILRRDFIDE